MEQIGKALKNLRKSRKMTQIELAKEVDSCYVSISKLEHGGNVGTKLLDDVCKFFNVELGIISNETND